MENHEWEDEIIEGSRGQKRAEPNPFLFTRIESRLEDSRTGLVWNLKVKIAVGICSLTLLLNSFLIVQVLSDRVAEPARVETNYQLDSYQFDIY